MPKCTSTAMTLVLLTDAGKAQLFQTLQDFARQSLFSQLQILVLQKQRSLSNGQIKALCPNCEILPQRPDAAQGEMLAAAVQKATGHWLAFFHAGDRLESDACETLYNAAQDLDADFLLTEAMWYDGLMQEPVLLGEHNLYLQVQNQALPQCNALVNGLVALGKEGTGGMGAKLVKRELLTSLAPQAGEDGCLLHCLASAKRVGYVPGSCMRLCMQRQRKETIPFPVYTYKRIQDLLCGLERLKQENAIQLAAVTLLLPLLTELLYQSESKALPMLALLKQMHALSLQTALCEHNPYFAKRLAEADFLGKNAALRWLACLQQTPDEAAVEQLFALEAFQPMVSIVIPVYNGSLYMRQAIDSALGQTYPRLEVIVVNDGSNDEGQTEKIAKSYANRIRYFQKPNGGVATALNLGIEHMQGEYFSWLSHDDCYEPAKIENDIRCLFFQQDRTMLVSQGTKIMDGTGRYSCTVNLHTQYPARRLKDALFPLLRGGVNGCGLLIHKSHFKRVGLFDPALPTTQDYDLWFRMFRGQKLLYTSFSNVLTRNHAQQGSRVEPKHASACDALWIHMMDALTPLEKTALEGSEALFYQRTYEVLTVVGIAKGAIAHAAKRLGESLGMSEQELVRRGMLPTDLYTLYLSHSWKITKGLRALGYARRTQARGVFCKWKAMVEYLQSGEMNRQSDQVILASQSWRITAFLRRRK